MESYSCEVPLPMGKSLEITAIITWWQQRLEKACAPPPALQA